MSSLKSAGGMTIAHATSLPSLYKPWASASNHTYTRDSHYLFFRAPTVVLITLDKMENCEG